MKKILKWLLLIIILCAAAVFGMNAAVVSAGGSLLDRELSEALDAMGEEAGSINIKEENVPDLSGLPADADCILVLGAGVYADGTPTPMLRDRLDRGIELYRLGASGKILLTGDNGQVEYNEVEAMKNYVLAAGVPAEDVFLDHAGFSTYESMFRAGAVFNVRSAIVVTQRYHEYRALYIGKRLGLDVAGVAAADIGYSGDAFRGVREILARDKDFLQCIFKPDPTFLGDVIDIHGDGHASW